MSADRRLVLKIALYCNSFSLLICQDVALEYFGGQRKVVKMWIILVALLIMSILITYV